MARSLETIVDGGKAGTKAEADEKIDVAMASLRIGDPVYRSKLS